MRLPQLAIDISRVMCCDTSSNLLSLSRQKVKMTRVLIAVVLLVFVAVGHERVESTILRQVYRSALSPGSLPRPASCLGHNTDTTERRLSGLSSSGPGSSQGTGDGRTPSGASGPARPGSSQGTGVGRTPSGASGPATFSHQLGSIGPGSSQGTGVGRTPSGASGPATFSHQLGSIGPGSSQGMGVGRTPSGASGPAMKLACGKDEILTTESPNCGECSCGYKNREDGRPPNCSLTLVLRCACRDTLCRRTNDSICVSRSDCD
ncbi:uncharacterized protein LOC142587262 isoform X2 [Dermacentor variabilis]|uniref:uncharacterized protein LOC142587262 isoform X2 n=1 Tax=Dermacentor variabilis TaxID=34621 RepID=UPI003F5C8B5A